MRTQVASGFCFAADGTARYNILYVDQNGTLHRVRNVAAGYDLETLPEAPLSKTDFMPLYEKHWVKWEGQVDGNKDVWVKKAKYLHPPKDPVGTIKREIELGEALRARPHPNILKYHGCTHDDDGVVNALVFERLDVRLEDVIIDFWRNDVGIHYYDGIGRMTAETTEDATADDADAVHDPALGIPRISKDGIPFDVDTVMGALDPAFAHLRSLGYSYVDISGINIMWRWDKDIVNGQRSNGADDSKDGSDNDNDTKDDTADPKTTGPQTRPARTGRWCLIDLGSCFPSDYVFDSPFGTPGFWSAGPGTAAQAHTETRAHLVRWIETGFKATDQFKDAFKRQMRARHPKMHPK